MSSSVQIIKHRLGFFAHHFGNTLDFTGFRKDPCHISHWIFELNVWTKELPSRAYLSISRKSLPLRPISCGDREIENQTPRICSVYTLLRVYFYSLKKDFEKLFLYHRIKGIIQVIKSKKSIIYVFFCHLFSRMLFNCTLTSSISFSTSSVVSYCLSQHICKSVILRSYIGSS